MRHPNDWPATGPRPWRPPSLGQADQEQAALGPERQGPARPQPRFIPRPGPAPRFVPRPGPAPRFVPRPGPAPRFTPRPAPVRYRQLVPAIIGNELRIPMMWCDFGSCIAHYTHPDALGERDVRHRALAAGWSYDLLGRLACPSCVQRDATFWAAHLPAPARRY